jgi:hypothetical protein
MNSVIRRLKSINACDTCVLLQSNQTKKSMISSGLERPVEGGVGVTLIRSLIFIVDL